MEADTGSPERWLDEHAGALYRYALLRLRDEHKAEEMVQETLLAALQARARFSGGASVRTWLYAFMHYEWLELAVSIDAASTHGAVDPRGDLIARHHVL